MKRKSASARRLADFRRYQRIRSKPVIKLTRSEWSELNFSELDFVGWIRTVKLHDVSTETMVVENYWTTLMRNKHKKVTRK